MKGVSRLASLLLLAACVGCSAKLGVEFDPQEDFAGYRTWAWLPRQPAPPRGRGVHDPALDALIRQRVERELAARGYDQVVGDSPDFYVTYSVQIERQARLHSEQHADQMLFSHHNTPSYIVSGGARRVRIYEESTLVIDVADGKERQLVWRGIRTERVRGSFQPHAGAAVAEILDSFPPLQR
jgi:hypothetical protein